MSTNKQVIDLNFDGSRGHFLRAIQHQLDIVNLLLAGAELVSEESSRPNGFHNFNPASNWALGHEEARAKAIEWLNACLLRDAIEATDQFLGRCLSFCFAIQKAGKGDATTADLEEIFHSAPRRHHKLHFPAKLDELKCKYGVSPKFSEQVRSLNKLRTCLVHRLGVVSTLDLNADAHLDVTWISSKWVLRGLETGTTLVLHEPGGFLNEEAVLEMHIVEHTKSFSLGSTIALEKYDVYSTIFTLWRFGLACAEAIEQFALTSGVPVNTQQDP